VLLANYKQSTGALNRKKCKLNIKDKEKAGETNTLKWLHWGSRMELLGASTKRNDGGSGRPWCVAAQSWAAAPANLTDM